MADDIVERLRAKDVLTSIITSCFAVPGRHPGELADLMEEAADEIERLRLELDMTQATIRVPSQKDDVRTIERLREELVSALDKAARLRKALKPFAELIHKPVNIYEHNGVQLALIKYDGLSRLCRAAKAALGERDDD
jgi:uncharacterized membrane protein YccC